MAKLTNIIIHCSDSAFGSAADIRRWHLANGWSDIGYHFVIMNGLAVPETEKQKGLYIPLLDGMIELGRYLNGDNLVTGNEVGAHALGYNDRSIGICLIGVKEFTPKQFLSLARLVDILLKIYNIAIFDVEGHYEVCKNKTCPNFNVSRFLSDLPLYLTHNYVSGQLDPKRYAMGAK